MSPIWEVLDSIPTGGTKLCPWARYIAELGKQQVHSMKEAQDLKDKTITKVDKLFRDMTSEIKSTLLTFTHVVDVKKSHQTCKDA